MILADNGIIPPQEWNHSPEIKDNQGCGVHDYLTYN